MLRSTFYVCNSNLFFLDSEQTSDSTSKFVCLPNPFTFSTFFCLSGSIYSFLESKVFCGLGVFHFELPCLFPLYVIRFCLFLPLLYLQFVSLLQFSHTLLFGLC